MEEFEAYAYEEYTSSDEEEADGDDTYRYCRHLNHEIESNDPDCAGVRVDGEHWFAGAGRLIGDSTVLQQLRISIKGREDVTWLSELFQAPSHNQSIDTLLLSLDDNRTSMKALQILSTAFENNSNISKIHQEYDNPGDDGCMHASYMLSFLKMALSKCKNDHLESITLRSAKLCDV